MTTERVYFEEIWCGHEVRGWRTYQRQGDYRGAGHRRWVYWFLGNGRKQSEANWSEGYLLWMTEWNYDGTVHAQFDFVSPDGSLTDSPREKESPPCLWGVSDQTTPSMPAWMKDDEKWQAALDAQK